LCTLGVTLVEGGYFNLGKFGFTASTTPAGTLTGTIKLQGVNLDAVGNKGDIDMWSLGLLYSFGR